MNRADILTTVHIPSPEKDSPANSQAFQVAEESRKEETMELSTYQKFVDSLFLYSKMKGEMLKESIQQVIHLFGLLTSSKREQRDLLQQLKKKETRQTLVQIDFVKNESEQIKSLSKYYFCMIIEQLCAKIGYLSVKGAVQLINIYLSLSRSIFFMDNKFNWQHIVNSCNVTARNMNSIQNIKKEPFFAKMVYQICQIVHLIFKQYAVIFEMLDAHKDKKGNSFVEYVKGAGLRIFSQKIWRSVQNIMNIEKLNKSKIMYCDEINTLLRGLNVCLGLNSQFFDKNTVQQQVLPLLVQNMKLIQVSKGIHFKLVQTFILSLLIRRPFQQHTWNHVIRSIIQDNNMKRFQYLQVLTQIMMDDPYFSQLQPLTSNATILFLQRLIQSSKQILFYGPQKDKFILESICNILKENPDRFWLQKQTSYKNVVRYFRYVESRAIQNYQLSDSSEIDEDQSVQSQQENAMFISFIRYARLINVICFPRPKATINPQQLRTLVKNNQLFQFFVDSLHNICSLKPYQRNNLKDELRQHNVSISQAYQFFHRMIISNSDALLQQKKTIELIFPSFDAFIKEITVNYLRQEGQYSDNEHVCIEAINELIYNNKFTSAIKIVVNQLSNLNLKNVKIYSTGIHQDFQIYPELLYVVERLLKNKQNLVPISYQVILSAKFNPDLLGYQWFKTIGEYLLQLPEQYHAQNLYQYADILTLCLKEVPENHQIIKYLPHYFNFKFIRVYINHILSVGYERGSLMNKLVEGYCYDKVMIGIKLLKELTKLIIYEREINQEDFIPAQIKQFFTISQRGRSNYINFAKITLSYSSALIILLLSNSFIRDPAIESLFPHMKSNVFETLININKINPSEGLSSHVVAFSHFNSSISKEEKVEFNLSKLLQAEILQRPSHMGLEYLLSLEKHTFSMKKMMFEKANEIQNEKGLAFMKLKSHFISVHWKQMQKLNPQVNGHRAWEYISHEMSEIISQIDRWIIEQQQKDELSLSNNEHVDAILLNIYELSLLLFSNSNKHYYSKYMASYFELFMNLQLNRSSILNQRQTPLTQTYVKSLLTFFSSKSLLTSPTFLKLKTKEIKKSLYIFLMKTIQLTYESSYNIKKEETILQIMQFGIAFLMELVNSKDKHYLIWLRNLIEKIESRPFKSQNLSTKEIIISLLIKNEIKGKIRSSAFNNTENINFTNDSWTLSLPLINLNIQHAQLLLTQLPNIYHKHQINFVSTCNYLLQLFKTKQIRQLSSSNHFNHNPNHMIDVLWNLTLKAMADNKSYHIVWMLEMVIQLLKNADAKGLQLEKKIFKVVIGSQMLHDRVGYLMNKLGAVFADKYINLWLLNSKMQLQVDSKINFAQKSQLLAYLRLFTIFHFNSPHPPTIQSHQPTNSKLIASFENILPLLIELLKVRNQPYQRNAQWQSPIIALDVCLLAYEVSNGVLVELQRAEVGLALRNKNGMDLIDQIMNVEFMSIITLWMPLLIQPQTFTQLYFQNDSQTRINNLLQLLLQLNKKIWHYKHYENVLKPIMLNFNNRIYSGSKISKQMCFINLSKLSSNLRVDYDCMMQRLVDGFSFVDGLFKHIVVGYSSCLYKIDPRIMQQYKAIHT